MRALSRRATATNPLFELETGRMTEARFLELLSRELSSQLGRAGRARTASASATSSTCTRTSR